MRPKQIRIRITEAAAEKYNVGQERFFDAKPEYFSDERPTHEQSFEEYAVESPLIGATARIRSSAVTLSRSEFEIV